MKTNLGITNAEKIKKIEYYLYNIKYHIIDEEYTFNEENIFNIKYLEKIHIFLFHDLYSIEECKIKESISESIKKELNEKLEILRNMLYESNIEKMSDIIYYIWEKQIFYDGNTRTLLCYLKILSKAFNFEIEYDFTKDVEEDYFIDKVIDSIKKVK